MSKSEMEELNGFKQTRKSFNKEFDSLLAQGFIKRTKLDGDTEVRKESEETKTVEVKQKREKK